MRDGHKNRTQGQMNGRTKSIKRHYREFFHLTGNADGKREKSQTDRQFIRKTRVKNFVSLHVSWCCVPQGVTR